MISKLAVIDIMSINIMIDVIMQWKHYILY